MTGAAVADAVARKDKVFPGGTINDFTMPAGTDLVVARAESTTVWDTEGRAYQDHLLGSGPLVLGHAHPVVRAALEAQLRDGTTYYLPSVPAVELAEELCRYVPAAEQVRYCSDGSEAIFYALRIARGYTGRDLVLKFEGGFHGHSDYALQSFAPPASGPFPAARPDTAGVPGAVAASVLVCPYNDADAVAHVLAKHGDRVAAILVEPVQRAIEPLPGFLAALRELADRHGCLLVFDEVVTGFRLALGGAQEVYGVRPDLTTLGKSMSGGLPLACVVGPEAIMATAAGTAQPGGIYMSGTLNGNPLGAAAGLATVRELAATGGCERMTALGTRLKDGLAARLAEHVDGPACVIGPPALCEVVFGVEQVHDYAGYLRGDRERALAFGRGLLRRGFLVRPGTKIYLSAVHDERQIDRLLEAAAEALGDLTEDDR